MFANCPQCFRPNKVAVDEDGKITCKGCGHRFNAPDSNQPSDSASLPPLPQAGIQAPAISQEQEPQAVDSSIAAPVAVPAPTPSNQSSEAPKAISVPSPIAVPSPFGDKPGSEKSTLQPIAVPAPIQEPIPPVQETEDYDQSSGIESSEQTASPEPPPSIVPQQDLSTLSIPDLPVPQPSAEIIANTYNLSLELQPTGMSFVESLSPFWQANFAPDGIPPSDVTMLRPFVFAPDTAVNIDDEEDREQIPEDHLAYTSLPTKPQLQEVDEEHPAIMVVIRETLHTLLRETHGPIEGLDLDQEQESAEEHAHTVEDTLELDNEELLKQLNAPPIPQQMSPQQTSPQPPPLAAEHVNHPNSPFVEEMSQFSPDAQQQVVSANDMIRQDYGSVNGDINNLPTPKIPPDEQSSHGHYSYQQSAYGETDDDIAHFQRSKKKPLAILAGISISIGIGIFFYLQQTPQAPQSIESEKTLASHKVGNSMPSTNQNETATTDSVDSVDTPVEATQTASATENQGEEQKPVQEQQVIEMASIEMDQAKTKASDSRQTSEAKRPRKHQRRRRTISSEEERPAPQPTKPRVTPDTFYRSGNSYLKQRKVSLAIEEYKKALQIDPTYAKAFRGLGIAYATMKKERNAVKAYEQYLRLSPSNSPDRPAVQKIIQDYYQARGQVAP